MENDADYNLTIQVTREGFGSYLDGIIPSDIAVACGAFSQSMRQIRNIDRIPIEGFAQVVVNLETMKDLNVNGTDVPVDIPIAEVTPAYIALGSGPQGSYTMSDILGAMSGLPYINHYKKIQSLLQSLATANLNAIYINMYLAVSWDQASGVVNYTTSAVENPVGSGNYDYSYTVNGITIGNGGGGYCRENAPLPTVSISGSPVQLSAVVDTNNANTPLTFGKITAINVVGSGGPISYGSGASPTPPNPGLILNIQPPPDNGTGGWPGMNTVVQNYINLANSEIASIQSQNPESSTQLNESWNSIGLQLKREQRARSIAFYPLEFPKDPFNPISLYPSTHYAFIDNLGIYAENTLPHMYSQTIEAIVDWSTIGGRSMVGVMREQRNQARLTEIGVPLDNNIPGELDQSVNNAVTKAWVANGNLNDLGVEAIGNTTIKNGDQTSALYVNNGTTDPIGFYDPTTDDYVVTNTKYVTGVDGINNNNNNTGNLTSTNNNSITTPVSNLQNGNNINSINNRGRTILQTGRQIVPGSMAGSQYQNLIRPRLNTSYISKQLTPVTYTVEEAVEEVIKCNCDCWEEP